MARDTAPARSVPEPAVLRAVRGALWLILSGSSARVIGVLGTLAVTRFLAPEEYGEASLAALVVQIAFMLTNGGLAQYVAARPKAGPEVVFHVTVFFVLLGAVGLAATVLLGDRIGSALHAPGIVRYLPAIGLAAVLDRVATVQDRVQLRAMRFRSVGVQRSLGELAYSAVSVALAAFAAGTSFGGANAIVWGTLARSVLKVVTFSATTARREWLSPCRLDLATSRELFAFGAPMALVAVFGFGAQKLDNLVFQVHFGLAWLTFYNLAYNFADMPAALVGEQIGDVLVPSLAHVEDDRRRTEILLLSMRTMVLVVAPLAVGLAVIAPTLSKLAVGGGYEEGVAEILEVLAMLSIARTVAWVANSYLQVRNRPRWIMGLEGARMVGIVVVMNLVIFAATAAGRAHAVRAACASVVVVFSASALGYMWAIRRLDGVTLRAQIAPLLAPLLACVPMALAVVATRRLVAHFGLLVWGSPLAHGLGEQLRLHAPRLALEIAVGAAVFVPSALILAPSSSRELLRLTRDAIAERRGGDARGEP